MRPITYTYDGWSYCVFSLNEGDQPQKVIDLLKQHFKLNEHAYYGSQSPDGARWTVMAQITWKGRSFQDYCDFVEETWKNLYPTISSSCVQLPLSANSGFLYEWLCEIIILPEGASGQTVGSLPGLEMSHDKREGELVMGKISKFFKDFPPQPR